MYLCGLHHSILWAKARFILTVHSRYAHGQTILYNILSVRDRTVPWLWWIPWKLLLEQSEVWPTGDWNVAVPSGSVVPSFFYILSSVTHSTWHSRVRAQTHGRSCRIFGGQVSLEQFFSQYFSVPLQVSFRQWSLVRARLRLSLIAVQWVCWVCRVL
jgi:hypothetical protein